LVLEVLVTAIKVQAELIQRFLLSHQQAEAPVVVMEQQQKMVLVVVLVAVVLTQVVQVALVHQDKVMLEAHNLVPLTQEQVAVVQEHRVQQIHLALQVALVVMVQHLAFQVHQ
jgi:hypothetical protein